MDSSELYHIKQQFFLGAYRTLADLALPDPNSPDYNHALLILRNEFQEAKSDLEESLEQQKGDPEAQAAYVVAGGLGALKKSETEDLWSEFSNEHPGHPLVRDVSQKADIFDRALTKFTVPPLADAAAA